MLLPPKWLLPLAVRKALLWRLLLWKLLWYLGLDIAPGYLPAWLSARVGVAFLGLQWGQGRWEYTRWGKGRGRLWQGYLATGTFPPHAGAGARGSRCPVAPCARASTGVHCRVRARSTQKTGGRGRARCWEQARSKARSTAQRLALANWSITQT